MNLKKVYLSVIFGLITLTSSCVTSDNSVNDTSKSDVINLDVRQAQLISDITDNEKYLNKDLLYQLDTLEDSDNVSVIITMDSNGLASKYNENTMGYRSLSSYAQGEYANELTLKMLAGQENFAQYILKEGYVNEINHHYTTLFNGFSASTTYGQLKALEKANFGVKVTVSEVYAEPESQTTSEGSYDAVTNFVNVYETGIFNSSGVGYDGENTAVAILDSGFDIHHTVFQNMPNTPMISKDEVQDVLYDSNAYSYHKDIKVQDVYMNSKIPFVYDYADKDSDVAPYDSNHGTHVAGIIGGKDDVITGVAVNTQLVLMKVFGDINNGALQEDILAALEDAILLGVDAINLSLGSACGFARSSDNEYINVVYDSIEDAGISLIVAASNDYSSGYGGENSNTNKASNPDSATVGSPGTYSSTFSVASISGEKSKYMVDKEGHTFFFNNANNSAGKAYDFYEMLYESLNTEKDKIEVEYVTVPGVGKKVNYSNIDVKGKIALVKRGDTSFEEKAQVALSQGALACIIYNNIAGEVYMNAGNKLEIPLCSISKDDGEYLAKKGTGTLVLDKSYLAGPFMSDFSSWGPVSNLALKPEITAHGGSILSSVPGGGYEKISGTSMACPNLCGVVILVRQALKERYHNITPVELNNLSNQLLMSTGTIVLDEQGNPYSPRKQGAGLGNLEAALNTLAYLSVEGSTKSKLDLLDDPEGKGVYELKFNLNNISDKKLTYRLSNYTMTESLSTSDPEYVAEKAYMLNPKTSVKVAGVPLDGDVITVEANKSVEITYTLTLTSEEKKYIQKSFKNGIYVEGFAVLNSLDEGGINLSIPFLAFYGDWTVAPMFDKTFYEVESEAHDGSIDYEDKLKADYYATTPLGTYYYSYIIPLGSYVYEIDETKYDPIPASEEHAAIGYSLNTINGITTVYAGLLRNAKKMTTTIVNADTGEEVYYHVKYDEHKAYFSGTIVPGYDLINITAFDLGLANNTKYTFKMVAELDYGDGGLSNNLNNTFEFSFYVDYESPIITDAEYYSKYDKTLKDYRYYVDVYVYDNHYAQSIRPFTVIDGKLVSLSDNVIPIYGEKGQINKVTVEITDYMDLLRYGKLEHEGIEFPMSNGLGFLVDDYALNQSYSYVAFPGTDSDNIYYKDLEKSGGSYFYSKPLYPGDILDLTKMLTSDDPNLAEDEEEQARYFANLSWKSSNESVAKVKNGIVEVVGSGSALITCTTLNSDGTMYYTTLKINSRKKDVTADSNQKLTDIQFTYFETLKAFIDGPEVSEIGEVGDKIFFTDKSNISCYPSEQVKINFALEPWNLKDYILHWTSTNEKVATVDENGVVTALKEGSATIKLAVEIDGRTSSLIASVRVNVKSEFVVEGTTLIAYKGLGGDVVIPDDEGILYIGSFAFSLYTTDYEIKIEEDDYDAAKTPGGNETLTSVVIPADVLEVQKYAFFNCKNLETVTFLSDDKGESCPFIRESAFADNVNLKNINLDKIELIGEKAFANCTSLVDADISKVYAIGRKAFENCTSLLYVDISALRNAGEEVFANCTSLKTIDNDVFTKFSEGMFKNSGLTTLNFKADRIPNNCFTNCDDLLDVTIENDIVYVGAGAFADCDKLKVVKFNDGVGTEFIYEYAFAECKSLTSVTLPDSEFDFEQFAFSNCSLLNKVIFNKDTFIVNNLGSLFSGCDNLSSFEVNANNSYYVASNNLLLSKDNKTIILAALNYEYGDYTIPSGIIKIADGAFSSISKMTSLIISNEVSEIGIGAFAYCENLVNVNFLNPNVEVNDKAFMSCSKLSSVINLDKLTVYNSYSFADTALETIKLNDDAIINNSAFRSIKTLKSVNIGLNTIVGEYAFADNDALETVIINADEIGVGAFANCSSLKNIDLVNVERILDSAFINCDQLSNVQLNNCKYIGNYAFADCNNLTSVYFEKIEEIGSYAFAITDNSANLIEELVLPDSLITIGEYAFAYLPNLKSVNIGSSINSIGSRAFSNCSNLVEITTIGNVETISEGMFFEDSNLVSVNIGGIKVVEDGAFKSCTKLVNIDLTNVNYIGVEGFSYCKALSTLDLKNVVTLDNGAFMSADNVTSVNIPKVETIGYQALSVINVTEIRLPDTISYIAPTAFNYNVKMTALMNMSGEDTCVVNDYVVLDKGVLYTVTENGKYLLHTYPTAKPDLEYEVMMGTIRIESFAGYFNNNIQKLIFPDTLKLIGNKCFYGSLKLHTIEFKSTVAPILEGTISEDDVNISYDKNKNPEIYELLNKYFQINGYSPLYYGQFRDMIGRATKMNIIIPSNSETVGYDSVLYKLYFKEPKISEYEALNAKSIDYLNKVSIVPTEVSLSDEKIIQDARTAYNLLDQDLTNYGYTSEYLDALYANLVQAETNWLELKLARINKIYAHLIEAINKLGSKYEFDKITEYYEIVEALELVDKEDEKYINTENVESFRKEFDEYFKDLSEDVNILNDVSTLPKTNVNKVGLAVVISINGLSGLLTIAINILRKRWFLF